MNNLAPRCFEIMKPFSTAACPIPDPVVVCGRPKGHNGPHRSATALERYRVRQNWKRRKKL